MISAPYYYIKLYHDHFPVFYTGPGRRRRGRKKYNKFGIERERRKKTCCGGETVQATYIFHLLRQRFNIIFQRWWPPSLFPRLLLLFWVSLPIFLYTFHSLSSLCATARCSVAHTIHQLAVRSSPLRYSDF